jgi:hypothetical protein
MISKIKFPEVWDEMNRNERTDLKGIFTELNAGINS